MEQRRKNDLFQLNNSVWNGREDVIQLDSTLDSSLKKNTSFIKRLRNGINQSALPTFLEEIRTLSLHKYLSEIVLASYDGLCKLKSPSDIFAGVEIISALHQRFGKDDFTSYLGWYVANGLSQPDNSHMKNLNEDVREKEEKERIARQKLLLRSATELWIVGVLTKFNEIRKPKGFTKESNLGKGIIDRLGSETTAVAQSIPELNKPFPLAIFREIISGDRDYVNLPIISSFVKAFARDIFGSTTQNSRDNDGDTKEKDSTAEDRMRIDDNRSKSHVDDPHVANADVANAREEFTNLVQSYYEGLKRLIIKDQNFLAAQGCRNLDAYIKYGEVFGDRQAQFERQLRAQNKLFANAQILADVLKLNLPEISDITIPSQKNADGIEIIKAQTYFDHANNPQNLWEDEEEYKFYQQLADLKPYLPSSVIEEASKNASDKSASKPNVLDQFQDDAATEQDASVEESEVAEKANEGLLTGGDVSIGAEMDVLLGKLQNLASPEMVDEVAIEFCRLNSKASRNRMLKAIRVVPKSRLDLIPYFARLVATLAKYMPDIAQGVVTWLAAEFRSLQGRKHRKGLEIPRTVNIRYIAELAKFKVIPEHTIFHCLKVSLDDFSHSNIEIICNIMNICGKYLFWNPDTSARMKYYLITLEKKKTAQHLAAQDRLMIETAIFSVCPPENIKFKEIKDRSPTEQFVRKLIYEDLTDKTIYKVVKQIRKLHWEEKDVMIFLRKIFIKPWNIDFGRIYLLAAALGLLRKYHSDFTIAVVDELLESINQGLERNDYRHYQRRMSEIKYLGELYTYRMIDSSIIFDTLFRITTYSWGGLPNPQVNNTLDPPDDYFRVQMICILLDSCGIYFVKGNLKKRLDFFLSFFEYYFHTKEQVPKEIEFMVHNIYSSLRPKWQLATNIEEAGNRFAENVKTTYKETASNGNMMLNDYEIDSSSNDSGRQSIGIPNEEHTGLEDEMDSQGSDVDETLQTKGENLGSIQENGNPATEAIQEDDEEFDREFSMMVADSVQSRASERIPVFDMPLPMRNTTRSMQSESRIPDVEKRDDAESMKFMLLSKKGSKATTRPVDLPLNVPFATALQSQQQANREEQQRIKNLVLKYSF